MLKKIAIGSFGTFVFLLATVGSTSLSAGGENFLQLCLHGKDDKNNICSTDHCRAESCQRAAETGHIRAILHLGIAHVYGMGVSKDYLKAYMYFEIIRQMSHTFGRDESFEAQMLSRRPLYEVGMIMTDDEMYQAYILAQEWIRDKLKTTQKQD